MWLLAAGRAKVSAMVAQEDPGEVRCRPVVSTEQVDDCRG